MSLFGSQIGTYSVRDLENFILQNYGKQVSWDGKRKNLLKFGNNPDCGTSFEDVWTTGGTEDLPDDNLITHVASTNAGDTQVCVVEGHTIDADGNLTFVTQQVTLAGQTKTALTTPLARAVNLYNNDSTDFAGVVYVARDVTFTSGVPASDIHITVPVGSNGAQKCMTSISQYDFWALTSLTVHVRRASGSGAAVDFSVQFRLKGKVWRDLLVPVSLTRDGGTVQLVASYPIVMPPNTDIRVRAISSATGTSVGASIGGTLLIDKDRL